MKKINEAYGSFRGYSSSSGSSHGHAYGGGGFGKSKRADDEYHTPDTATTTHKIAMHVSKPGVEKHSRTVTISNSTKTHDEAKAAARDHLKKQGYTIHEEVELEEARANTAGVRAGLSRRATKVPLTPEQQQAKDAAKFDKWKAKNQAPVKEETDKSEYDYEGQMTRIQLQTIMRNSKDMIDMMGNDDNLPEWVQSKITLSHDYLTTARDYLQSKQELGEDKDPCWDNYKRKPGTKKFAPGSCVKEENVTEETYADAEVHLKQAEAAQKEGNIGLHHRHMTSFHDKMSEWHTSRGRHGSAESHSDKADEHHEKALKLGEATSARIRIQQAFEREQERGARERAQGQKLLNPAAKPVIKPEEIKKKSPVAEAIEDGVTEGLARLISKSIKRVTATKPTPQEKADIRLNK